jgi:hypothetical protein
MSYLPRLFGSVFAAAALLGASAIFAEDATTKTYPSYHAAAAALIAAVAAKDEAAEKEILGANALELLSSGDSTADEDSRLSFLKHYREAHGFVRETQDRVLLTIGPSGWMLPFPIVRADGGWHFDTAAGAQELTYRRIGRNELDAIQVCRALYAAQKAYAVNGHDDNPAGAYAQHFRSQPGTQTGLYWDVKEGEAESPAGSLVAEAASERERDGVAKQAGKPTPFHGYYYRILTAQGPHARGGAEDYIKDGRMTGGFAIVAYPAEYGASGVMSFLISRHGTVYQSDLGAATEQTAKAMTAFDPDSSWKVAH